MADTMNAEPSRFFEGDLQQLRCFYYAATFRSFTRAAEKLSTGQPSVSNHIKLLERLLGVTLFHRHRRGVTLTDEGGILLELVSPLVEGIDRLEGEMGERAGGLAGQEVRLAAGQELLLHLVGPILEAYRRDHPAVRLVVYSSVRQQVHAMVSEDVVDFGIAARAGLPPDLESEEVLADELVLVAPAGHALAQEDQISLSDIARFPILMPAPESSTRRTIELAFEDSGLDLRVAMELERWHLIQEFVALGQGIALVPRFSVSGGGERLAIRHVRHGFPPLSYGIITRKGRHLSPATRSLIAAIRERGETRETGGQQ